MLNPALFRRLARVSLAAFALMISTASQAQTGYTIIDLGTLGGVASEGWSINASGQVTGYADTAVSGVSHAVRWTGTTLEDLGTLGGTTSLGRYINDSGQVAGTSQTTGNAATHAVRWTGTTAEDLGTLGGTNSDAYGINASGQVTGSAQLSGSAAYHAVRWTGTTAQDLGTLGGLTSYGNNINDSGQVAGIAFLADNVNYHAVRWTGTTKQDLGVLGGTKSVGWVINASGQVAGHTYTAGNAAFHATRWTGTTPTDLGTLGGKNSSSYAVNVYGDVVGASDNTSGGTSAFLYTAGRLIDLNTVLPPGSGWHLSYANGISGNGWITGQGAVNGLTHAYLLIPGPNIVSGSITLEGVSNLGAVSSAAPLGVFDLSFRTPNTTNVIYTADVALTPLPGKANGAFAVANIPAGAYDIAIKGGKSLRVVLRNVTISARTSLTNVMLPAGDVNGDNSIDLADFGVLVNAYGSAAGDGNGGYDPSCDLNYDGVNDIADFGLLVNEYGNVGAL